jgi:L-asparaginase
MDRKITIIGMGGTIAMVQGPNGLVPDKNVEDLIASEAQALVTVAFDKIDLLSLPSANITFDHIQLLARTIESAERNGSQGIVVIQGTDTIEETAFALELLVNCSLPIIVTGAMRAASHRSTDGPANLRAAIMVALNGAWGAGVLVVINEEIHAARYVRKLHTLSLNAFQSPDFGPLGRLHEGRLRKIVTNLPTLGILNPQIDKALPKVAICKITMDQDSLVLGRLEDLGFDGCILEAMGAGHIPASLVSTIEQAAQNMPVVLCSRTAAGAICEDTYGYPGSETDLLRRGVLSGGALSSLKARVLLTLCIAENGSEAAELYQNVMTQI